MLLSRALTKAGYAVASAADGTEGLAKVKAAKPDLILMDMSMPGMSGFEAIRRLKADPATKTIPVVALTGATTAADRDEAYEAGCDAYEAKPVNIERLLARMKELIRT
jgi:CheY-like chemotaxis protein